MLQVIQCDSSNIEVQINIFTLLLQVIQCDSSNIEVQFNIFTLLLQVIQCDSSNIEVQESEIITNGSVQPIHGTGI